MEIDWNNKKEVLWKMHFGNGECLEYASEELRGDKEVVLEAIKESYR